MACTVVQSLRIDGRLLRAWGIGAGSICREECDRWECGLRGRAGPREDLLDFLCCGDARRYIGSRWARLWASIKINSPATDDWTARCRLMGCIRSEPKTSALARNDPGLLAENDPPLHQDGASCPRATRGFGACPTQACPWHCPWDAVRIPVTHGAFCWKVRVLHAVGVDDGNPPRTPSAWMISLVSLLATAPNRVLGVGHSNRAEVGHSW